MNDTETPMFTKEVISKTVRLFKFSDKHKMTWQTFAEALADKENPEVRKGILQTLRDSEFDGYFWECSPFYSKELDASVPKFVIVNSKSLAKVKENGRPFSRYISRGKAAGSSAVCFKSIRGDADLIVPVGEENTENTYAHLANFVRYSKEPEQHALLQLVGEQILKKKSKEKPNVPVWLSTSGLGVHYLHIRLDSRPKYYTYAPFEKTPLRAP